MAEIVVEEWLNRQGYFTIRGVKLGVDEIDILAVRLNADGTIERRHIEVQVSVRPIGYICTGNAKRLSSDELAQNVEKWVNKKYFKQNKAQLLNLLGGGWTRELVFHKSKHPEEILAIQNYGIKILNLSEILKELQANNTPIKAAAGSDLLELMHMV